MNTPSPAQPEDDIRKAAAAPKVANSIPLDQPEDAALRKSLAEKLEFLKPTPDMYMEQAGYLEAAAEHEELIDEFLALFAQAKAEALTEELSVLNNLCMMEGTTVSGLNRVIGTHLAKLRSTQPAETPHTHEPDGQLYLSNPPQYKCKTCGEYYFAQAEAKAVRESQEHLVSHLKQQIARYGDGEIVYIKGEAVVPISKVLALYPHKDPKSTQPAEEQES